MKILHILDERWDSGVTAYGLAAASAVRARGHKVWVAARPGLAAARQAEESGLGVYPLTSLVSFWRWVGAEGFDVVNAHTGLGHSWGFLVTRFRPTALVRTRGEARALSVRPGQGILFRETEGVIAASQVLADAYAARFPFLMEKITRVYPGVVLAPMKAPPPLPLRVGILGRLDPVKGHGFFLEAVSSLRDRLTHEQFVVAGEDKKISRTFLEAEAARRGLSPWVKCVGRVPDAGAFMDECHLGVIASVESEAVSRAALEWLARGRPLVATEVGALPEMVLNGDNGFLVPPRHAAGLARALRLLMDDGAGRVKMGERARRTAETRFGLDRLGEETERVYGAACARRRGGSA